VRERLGIDRAHLVAVGDGRNDLDMLRWAGSEGRSFAMGQAPDDVKAAATDVTGPVVDDGLAQALRAL
jgi:hydroxymethylpyrimidine pyrophosphatase-like HAD family hydrolase